MKNKFIKVKKGGIVGDALVNFWAYLSFVLVILIFYAFFKIQATSVMENKITGLESEINADIILLNYLRIPVEVDDKLEGTNMADIIVKYYLEDENKKDLRELIQEKSNEIFNEKYPHLIWRLKISDKNGITTQDAELVVGGKTTTKLTEEKTLIDDLAFVCTSIPDPESKYSIKIELDLLNDRLISGHARSKYNKLGDNKLNCQNEI